MRDPRPTLNVPFRWGWTPSSSSRPKPTAALQRLRQSLHRTDRSASCRPAESMPAIWAVILHLRRFFAAGGSFMVPGSALAAEDFTVITALTRQAVRAVHQLKLASPFTERRRRQPVGPARNGRTLPGLYHCQPGPAQRLFHPDRYFIYADRRRRDFSRLQAVRQSLSGRKKKNKERLE